MKYRLVVPVVTLMIIIGFGSISVAHAQKTVVYKEAMYNIVSIEEFTSRMDTASADGPIVGLASADKATWKATVEEKGPIVVTSIIVLDNKEIEYQKVRTEKYSDLKKMHKNLAKAMGEIQKFMGTKKRQLKLK